ncbi:hypothetical protein KIL84_009868 [Mauremys mutica]|uniref:Uncharacterized protein n=1 Tax=Mauremys mutica TaxID=74926 RepID=A0A9D4B6K3_9SAUR|nr:hypothetical protein KIL84_009868 [Mauremys mutica]
MSPFPDFPAVSTCSSLSCAFPLGHPLQLLRLSLVMHCVVCQQPARTFQGNSAAPEQGGCLALCECQGRSGVQEGTDSMQQSVRMEGSTLLFPFPDIPSGISAATESGCRYSNGPETLQ